MSSTSAVLIGDGSLLVQCARAWLAKGHTIAAVATGNEEIAAWADAECIQCQRLDAENGFRIPAADYIFSVANLRILPAEVLGQARRMAINFHDGPLPRYAGLHATAWALMNSEASHGITWHEMTDRVDGGRIVRQATFPVSAGETSLSLNARCYEAGLAAFDDIATAIATDTLVLTPQAGERSWFGRDRRPPLLGTLDLSQGAASALRVVNALAFGHSANPLGRAKLWTGDRVLAIGSAQWTPSTVLRDAPTITESGSGTVRIAMPGGELHLEGVTDFRGQPATAGGPGSVLPVIDATLRTRLDSAAARVAPLERLAATALQMQAPELPYPRRTASGAGGSLRTLHHFPMRSSASAPQLVAAFAAWLARSCGVERVAMSFADAGTVREAQALPGWLDPWVPLPFTCKSASTTTALLGRAETVLRTVREGGAVPADLSVRLGERIHPAPPFGACCGVEPPAGEFELLLNQSAGGRLELVIDGRSFSETVARRIASQFDAWLARFSPDQAVSALPLLTPEEEAAFASINRTGCHFDDGQCAHAAVAAQAARTPDAVAVTSPGRSLTYAELEAQASRFATLLRARGARPGAIVGLSMGRTVDLVVAMLAVWKTGAAYLPLDPDYPADRLAFMVEDSHCAFVVVDGAAPRFSTATLAFSPAADAPSLPIEPQDAASPAYVIYTSGSTGKPKGVVVTHRNLANFFAGMDPRIPHDPPGHWLAVTSLSFDISVLELAWTLARGFTVALHSHVVREERPAPAFSLFYFASDHASEAKDRYRPLLEGAKFGDANGFQAVWTPERHFHAFGGLYPNPAVTSAAIAAATQRIQIRAGSCVLPLHHPIRVAEEWAFVDNISNGRVGISFASGWQPNDFVLAPGAFADRKNGMLSGIETVRRLWRGEKLSFPGPDGKPVEVRTLPRPIQPELPTWVTAAGNPETFDQAGALGCHLLTHLLGQTVEDVAGKIARYHDAWRRAGHAGRGQVTLMLHTFVGDDDDSVRETVRAPMKAYLRSSVDLIRQAAWTFPTFVQRGAESGRNPVEIMEQTPLSETEMDALLDHAFERYFRTSALFGTPERCLPMIEKLRDAGVDEIACLVDFGIATDTVLAHLHHLKALMDAARDMRPTERRVSVASQVLATKATHLQCTPSQAAMLVADAEGRSALQQLQVLMVGGEALPQELASQLLALVPGRVLNMYGPTETTIWSTVGQLTAGQPFVALGQPIANTRLRVRAANGADCAALAAGELWIGGEGLARGYLDRPELTAERFVADAGTGERWYRTGDLVRWHPDGAIEFLGRIDHQVKIRGHRIELGEIESVLLRQPGVRQAVVVARGDAGQQQLAAYVTETAGAKLDGTALREAIAAALPAVMVPDAIVVLAALPHTPNGKIDRKALPAPNAIPVRAAAAAPSTDTEQAIARIWQEVLGLPEVGLNDNFFDLGGHSLLVVQVQRRLREATGREVSITDMFRLSTVRALARHLSGEVKETSAADAGLQRAQARRAMRMRGQAAGVAGS